MISSTRVESEERPFEDHLAGVVALREDAREPVAGHHDGGADVLCGEDLDGLEHGELGRDLHDAAAGLVRSSSATVFIESSYMFG
jgi:hypothetical protein